MGVWMLRQLPKYHESKVVRSRDPAVLAPLDIVIDVGGTYDHSALRYDHHQRGFTETLDSHGFTIKLSACGLVYRHYGKEIITELYPQLRGQEDKLDTVYTKFYKAFLQALDAIDNGVEIASDPLYSDSTGLSARVARLNKRWNDPSPTPTDDERFEKASALCGEDFSAVLSHIVESEMAAYDLVEAALLKRHEVDAGGQVVKFESGGMPWKQHLYALEDKHSIPEHEQAKFVLYTDTAGMWRVQAVTVRGTAFTNRVSLLEEWRGVRDEEVRVCEEWSDCECCALRVKTTRAPQNISSHKLFLCDCFAVEYWKLVSLRSSRRSLLTQVLF